MNASQSELKLKIESNFSDADAFYAALTEAHRRLTPEQSELLNARLVLILANQVGDLSILNEALDIAENLSE